MSRMIFKKANVENILQLKEGEWCLSRGDALGKSTFAYICCPGKYYGNLSKHEISANGEVNPSVLVSYGDKEVFHDWITLEGWTA
jgi:hypothetical protein